MNKPEEKIDLSKAFRMGGFLLPTNEPEVEAFEAGLEKVIKKPVDWDDPLKILKRGEIKKVSLTPQSVDEKTINNLSMAAREGKEITDETRKRMDEDRKNKSR